MSVKKANSLQALVDRNSEATDTGGLVSLSTVANKARELFLFLVMMSEERLSCLFYFLIIYAESLFIYFQVNLEICFSPPAFSFSALSFCCSHSHGFSPWRYFLARDFLYFNGSDGIHDICYFRIKMIN